MDDRALLEAAAKAAGMSGTAVEYDDRMVFLEDGKSASIEWNPLTNDGDALRLAVKLGMTISIDLYDGCTRILNEFEAVILCHMHFDGGPETAARRAIVRAAAALATSDGNQK